MRTHRKQLFAVLAVAALLTPCLARAADGTFDRTLHVTGPVMLTVSTGSGYVHVSPGAGNEIHIVGHVRASNWSFGDSAERRVQAVVDRPPIDQAGNIVTVGHHADWVRNVSIDYEITAPRGTQLEVNSGSGDLRLMDLGASLKAETGSGSIEAQGFTGHVSLRSGSGDIHAILHNASDVEARTGSGGVHLEGVEGSLYAQTGSGDIQVAGKPASGWQIHTGSGDVTVSTQGAHFSLDASTGSGDIHSDPPLTMHGTLNRHHVTGEVNGGGSTVRISTGSGDVRIQS